MPDTPRYVTLVGEGPTDEAILRRLSHRCGLEVARTYTTLGKSQLDKRLSAYCRAASLPGQLWLVLRDLDRDAGCAPELVRRLLESPPKGLAFRLAVRQAEAWLLADREGLAAFLGIPKSRIPLAPELEPDAKATLVRLAGTSRRSEIRLDMVPPIGSRSRVGPGYTARVLEFVAKSWDVDRACRCSPSLEKCASAMASLGS